MYRVFKEGVGERVEGWWVGVEGWGAEVEEVGSGGRGAGS